MPQHDQLHRYLFENFGRAGELVNRFGNPATDP
ncbi:heat shock protein [Escherichia coli]|uniref:Heat shock protein n=1 Tax=Escherichia coli TaxID=562 RepID=A0A377DAS7_ECOLX|nr:heat shock protein [Escherichia coli]